jgi:hypothetical protein
MTHDRDHGRVRNVNRETEIQRHIQDKPDPSPWVVLLAWDRAGGRQSKTPWTQTRTAGRSTRWVMSFERQFASPQLVTATSVSEVSKK